MNLNIVYLEYKHSYKLMDICLKSKLWNLTYKIYKLSHSDLFFGEFGAVHFRWPQAWHGLDGFYNLSLWQLH